MAPKNQPKPKKATKNPTSSSQAKRKRNNPIPPSDVNPFISEEEKERFDTIKSYEVVGERKFDVTKLTKYPFFDTMIRQRGWEELNNMVHELNNKSVIMEFFANARFSPVKYQAYVRGKTIDFRPGATWKRARMLTYADFFHFPKAWASFVIQTLERTSCNFEIPLKRVITVAAILDEKPIDVCTLIANNIHELVTEKRAVVGHGSIINWLCEQKLVEEYDGDLYTSTVQPITDTAIDGFLKKYEAFLKERERRAATDGPQQQ